MELKISSNKSIFEAAELAKNTGESDLLIDIEKGSPILLNKLNLKLFSSGLEKLGVNYTIKTTDEKGNNLLGNTKNQLFTSPSEGLNGEKDILVDDKELEEEKAKEKKDLKKIIIFLGIFFGMLLVFFIATFAWWVVPTSNIELKVKSDILVKSIEIVADTEAKEQDFETQKIPALILGAEKTEKRTVSTTGKTTVGEKAKGEISLINKTDADKTFEAGTKLVLESNTNLIFLLDEETKVKKATESGTTLVYGTAETKVTAELIGSKYNVPVDETFVVEGEDKDKYTAKAIKDFDSGTSKEVNSVSDADILKVKNEMESYIKGEALKVLKDKLVGNQELSEGAYKLVTVKEEFDKKVGDISDTISLEQTVKITGVVYSKQDLEKVVKVAILKLIPENVSAPDTEEKTEITNAITESMEEYAPNKAKLKLQVKVKSFVTPKIDIEAVKKAIAGQKPKDAENYLSKLPRVTQIKIDLWPTLPKSLQTMPHKVDKINITIVNE